VVSVKPGRFYPQELYRRLVGCQGRSGEVRKISPPPGFDHRTVQPVAGRFTDYATGPTVAIGDPLYLVERTNAVVLSEKYNTI